MGEGGEEKFERAMEMISNTDWSEALKVISAGKEELYDLFGMPIKKVGSQGDQQNEKEEEKEKTKKEDDYMQIKT